MLQYTASKRRERRNVSGISEKHQWHPSLQSLAGLHSHRGFSHICSGQIHSQLSGWEEVFLEDILGKPSLFSPFWWMIAICYVQIHISKWGGEDTVRSGFSSALVNMNKIWVGKERYDDLWVSRGTVRVWKGHADALSFILYFIK